MDAGAPSYFSESNYFTLGRTAGHISFRIHSMSRYDWQICATCKINQFINTKIIIVDIALTSQYRIFSKKNGNTVYNIWAIIALCSWRGSHFICHFSSKQANVQTIFLFELSPLYACSVINHVFLFCKTWQICQQSPFLLPWFLLKLPNSALFWEMISQRKFLIGKC